MDMNARDGAICGDCLTILSQQEINATEGGQVFLCSKCKQAKESNTTDFSHLHALEERAVRIRERMRAVQHNDSQWRFQATQLFQTEQEIADERELLGLEDVDFEKLYAALSPEPEYDLPVCESCGNTLTIHDQIGTNGQSLLCRKCECEKLKVVAASPQGDGYGK